VARTGINPVWVYGPYLPDQVSTGSQPDRYVGFLAGALRLAPPWETDIAGHTVMWNVLLPAVVLPLRLFLVLYLYPFVEQRVTGEWHQDRHLCDRPRERPVRTGLGVAGIAFFGVLLLAGGDDVVTQTLRVSVDVPIWILRIALVVAPVLTFVVTRRLCRALLRAEQEALEEGEETGEVRQAVAGLRERASPGRDVPVPKRPGAAQRS
jgi:quinol-cytochrome oxidoreductase complex cytochrome b subunit